LIRQRPWGNLSRDAQIRLICDRPGMGACHACARHRRRSGVLAHDFGVIGVTTIQEAFDFLQNRGHAG
jgi:hypothetical protein